MKRVKFCVFCLVIGLVLSIQTVSAQTTVFNYQGSLKNGGNPANGNFDFEFRLYDALMGGTQNGSIQRLNVAVTNGIYSVPLDFGLAFLLPFADAFLEIAIRPAGSGSFTTLSPRQQINAVPYSIYARQAVTANNALNANALGGVAANQYVTTTSGGANFIQNQNAVNQSGNFTINGQGTANILRAETQFNIGASRILSTPGPGNLVAGPNSGSALTSGIANSIFGTFAGGSLATGSENSLFGQQSGCNLIGQSKNTILGAFAGCGGNIGSNNTMIGFGATAGNTPTSISNSTAIGSNAEVTASNSVILGSINGIGSCTPANNCDSVNVGIGTTAPQQTLHVNGTSEILSTGAGAGFKFRNRGSTSPNEDWVWYATNNIARLFNTGQGDLLTIQPTGEFAVNVLGSAGTVGLCRNASNQISTCSSSLRYKTNINQFGSGLDLISRLRPVTFNWLANNQFDFGLVAEEVAEIEPLLVTYNDKGEVEGVKYDRLGVVLINAVGEQQKQIEAQNETIRRQQNEIDSMKNFLCSQYPTAEFCEQ